MKLRRKLFSVKDPYDLSKDELFLGACRENWSYLMTHCEDYRKISEGLGVKSVDDIKRPEDLPVIPTMLLKQHDMRSGAYLASATSSGTSGNFSTIRFDLGGLWADLKMALKMSTYHKILSPRPCRYIVMGYKMHRGNKTAIAKTAFLTTLLAPAVSRKYILKYRDGAYKPDFEGIMEAVCKYARGKLPVRFMGFPAYTFFLLQMLDEKGVNVTLPKHSKILLGGGWKQFYQEAVDKQTFYKLAKKVLGIDEENICEYYGAVEHQILYTHCRNHNFHVPVYSRVVIRDPDTLEPIGKDRIGLMNLITPLLTATPVLSIMTDDLGVLHDGSKCGCGIEAPYFEIIGRVAPGEIKTCAAGAADILNGAGK